MRMLTVAFAVLTLFGQTYPPPFPRDGAIKLLENERVVVWDVTWPNGRPTAMHQHTHDIVGAFLADGTRMITTPDGVKQASATKTADVVFSRKGVVHKEEGTSDPPTRAILIELKEDMALSQPDAQSDVPPAFPRDGAKQLMDNARVTIWDYRWTPGVVIPFHRHARDTVVIWFDNGKIRSTPKTGASSEIEAVFGQVRYGTRGTVHREELVEGSPRAVIIELK